MRVVIDAVEGTTWNGDFDRAQFIRQFAVTENAVYVGGVYHNQYQLGSNPPPASEPVFIARYDLEGERVWFQEFLFTATVANPRFFTADGALTVDADGDPVVVINAPENTAGPYLFKLKASDGTLLQ